MKNLYRPIALAMTLGVAACGGNDSGNKEQKLASFVVRQENAEVANGYDVQLSYGQIVDAMTLSPVPGQHDAYVLRIGTLDQKTSGFDTSVGLILAYDIDRDGRPDNFHLVNILEGDPLEQLAIPSRLAKIERTLLQEREETR